MWDIIQNVIQNCDVINEPVGHEVSLPTLSVLDVDPQMDDVGVESDEEIVLQAVINSSSDSDSD